MVTNDGSELKITDPEGDVLYINAHSDRFYFESSSGHLEIVVQVDREEAKQIVEFLQGWLKT